MTQATYKEVNNHIRYMGMLMRKIEDCHSDCRNDDGFCRNFNSGTIKNLSPELSKAASKLKRMMQYGYSK